MNRTHLAAFHAVAEAGSFAAAARVAMVGQPALSTHVADLETALNARLFDRLPRGVRLTEAGSLLLTYARRIDAIEREAEQAVADLRGLRRGRLRIGASTTVGAYLLPAMIARFQSQHPGIEIALEIGNTDDVQRWLLAATVDVGLIEGHAEHAELRVTEIARDELVVIAPRRHPILAEQDVRPSSLAGHPLLLREEGSGTRDVVARALAGRRVRPTRTMTIGSTEAIKQAVIAGLGLAIVSRMTISNELAAKSLEVVAMRDWKISRPLSLAEASGQYVSAAAAEFILMLRGSIARTR